MAEAHDLSGRQVGRYRVLSLIGAGGMGAVYEASDPDLRRIVALKVLPPALVADRARLQRFTQEARTASALNHPHVVAVHEVGVQQLDDVLIHYIAMERVEGRTLRDALAAGRLPLRKILELMGQVADAIGAAHAAGIVHRDLKPENIMVTNTGYAKVLDFGLAKLREDEEILDEDSTQVISTATGAILGTVGYMSPEQAQGKPADARSDIFAVGCILYEAVTGRRAFKGASRVETLHNVIQIDPEPILAPAELRRIVRKALAKDPDARYQSAKDLAIDLRELARDVDNAPQAQRLRGPLIPLLFILAAVLVAIPVLIWSFPRRPAVITKVISQIRPPAGLAFSDAAISPDGTTICFVGRSRDSSSLYLRRLDSTDVMKVEGTGGAFAPFWAPDNKWIGYSANGRMWKTLAAGGTSPLPICLIPPSGVIASWGRGTILFAGGPGGRREIMRVSDAGGIPVPVTSLGDAEWKHTYPHWFPDGEHFLYLVLATGSVESNVVLASVRSAERTVLVRGVLKALPIGDDRLLYAKEGELLTQQVDLRKKATLGTPAPVTSDVYCGPAGYAEFSVSQTGVVTYRTNTSTGRLMLMDRKGAEIRLLSDQCIFIGPHSLSPDDGKAAVTCAARATGFGDIWIYDVARASQERFTSDPGTEANPVWTHDGQSIIYSTTGGGSSSLAQRTVAEGRLKQLIPTDKLRIARSLSPDGSTLFFSSSDPRLGSEIFALNILTRWTEPVFSSVYNHARQPEVSPSGKWIAVAAGGWGQLGTYVHNLSSPVQLHSRISTNGGREPRWRDDEAELFYVSGDSRAVMAATPTTGQWNNPVVTELFRVGADIVGFDVAKDGQSFLISTHTPGPDDGSLHIIMGAY